MTNFNTLSEACATAPPGAEHACPGCPGCGCHVFAIPPDPDEGGEAEAEPGAPTTPPAVLIAAADHMQQYGWIPNEYYRTEDPAGPRACSVCPRGAIAVVVAGHPLYFVDWPVHCESPDDPGADASVVEAELADYALIAATETALAGYLLVQGVTPLSFTEHTGPGELIEHWADADDRTMPQILGAMRAAAERGRAS